MSQPQRVAPSLPAARARTPLEGTRLLGALVLVVAAMVAAVVAVYGTGEPGVRAVIRWTARSSLVLFLAAFVASSARLFWRVPATAWLLRNRRRVGLSFAFSHALHLAGIGVLAARFPAAFEPDTATLLGGGLGYAFLAAMVATSSDEAVKRLGARRWRLLHKTGMWVLFAIFAQSYLVAPFVDPRYAPLGLATAGALGLRVAAWWRGRAPRQAPAASVR